MLNPRNLGEIANFNGIGKVTGPECGDIMSVFIKVSGERITDISFKTVGCWANIAASSMVTERARGMTLEQARHISSRDLAQDLGGVPEDKAHCIELPICALRRAIADFEKRRVA